jgi:hypothetical protein
MDLATEETNEYVNSILKAGNLNPKMDWANSL